MAEGSPSSNTQTVTHHTFSHTNRETERHTQTPTHKLTPTHSHTERLTHTYTHTQILTHRETGTPTETHTHRQSNKFSSDSDDEDISIWIVHKETHSLVNFFFFSFIC